MSHQSVSLTSHQSFQSIQIPINPNTNQSKYETTTNFIILTTANGTLIDHVYCSNVPDNTIVEVQDTYYSDHDTVYYSLPL